jgi:hypothetical protein
MKAIAVYQFYFPYVLPRADDWPTEYIGFKFPNFRVGLRPRNPHEKLFPHEIDETLSSMTLKLTRISPPMGGSAISVRDRCFDRIEARVDGDLVDSSGAKRQDVQEAFRNAAITVCNAFLNHCRVIAMSAFVRGVEQEYRIEDGKFYVQTPHTITWFNGEDGGFLPAYGDANACATAGAVRSPESGSVSINAIYRSLESGEQPSLPRSLIVDAEELLRATRIRESIICLATACEVGSDEYLKRKGKNEDADVKRIMKNRQQSFAERRYHSVPTLLDDRSLKTEENASFIIVEQMYRSRNNLAHRGTLTFGDVEAPITVDQPLATHFLRACEVALSWIERL